MALPDEQQQAATRLRPVAFTKRLVVGRRLTSYRLEHQLLPKILALPVFASDQLSSVAYATEEMLIVLLLLGTAGLTYLVPLGFGVAALLVIVITSYRQTVAAYPKGGGSYIVAKENLGTIPGLTAAAAILTSYILTVSVSVTAGAIAVTSAATGLADYKMLLAIVFVVLITIANLRGAKEAGRLFAIPTYGFVAVVGITLAVGFFECATSGCPEPETTSDQHEAVAALSVFLLLRAFSSGATALTGVEAIADGVQAFRRPQAKNAATTLLVMGAFSIPMFLGITILTDQIGITVSEETGGSRSVLAEIGYVVFDGGAMFYVLQVFTSLILILAANTAYQDFPRLSSILAGDGFMPSQMKNRGHRLVFSNGIVVLSMLAILLIIAFNADLTRLIQLYVFGVFTALTLSQAGMVRRWWRLRGQGWRWKTAVNVVGATTTGVVLLIIVITRFRLGVWMVMVAVPPIVLSFLWTRRHYRRTSAILRARALSPASDVELTTVILVTDLDAPTGLAIAYLRLLRPEACVPLYVGPPERFDEVSGRWRAVAPRLGELELLPEGRAHRTRAVRRYVRSMARTPDDFVAVVVPEVIRTRSWFEYVRQRSVLWLKASLLFEPDVAVMDVPMLPEEVEDAVRTVDRPLEPARSVVLMPVSAVHDGTVRAADLAAAMNASFAEALFFAADPDDVPAIAKDWRDREMPLPLSVVEAPFRDIGQPLLAEVRRHTSTPGTVVTVVLPEFVVTRWWEHFFHNQTGLFIKRLLLFEPFVVLVSVPYHLAENEADETRVHAPA